MIQLRDLLLAEFRESLPSHLEGMWQKNQHLPIEPEDLAALLRQELVESLNKVAHDESDPYRFEHGIVRMPVAMQVLEEWLAKKLEESK